MVSTIPTIDSIVDSIAEKFEGLTYLAVGSGTSTPTTSDTALETEIARVESIISASIADNEVSCKFEGLFPIDAFDGSTDLAEVGGLDAASAGNLGFRQSPEITLTPPVNQQVYVKTRLKAVVENI